MITRYLVVGLVLSATAHVFLFAPWRSTLHREENNKIATERPVQVMLPEAPPAPAPVETAVKPPAKSPAKHPAPRPPQPPAAESPQRLAEVVRGKGAPPEERRGETVPPGRTAAAEASAPEGDEQPLPPLRLDVSDPATVLSASRSMGILLVVMDWTGRVRARVEVDEAGPPRTAPIGDTSGYSNRVRLLPSRGYFGTVLARLCERYSDLPSSSRLAFLVPAGLDAQWLARQRELVAAAGGGAAEGAAITGRYVRRGDGKYELRIELAEEERP